MSLVATLQPVVEALETLGIAYHVGGSVASSAHGAPRATNDVDVVVDLRAEHVSPLVHLLRGAYYIAPELLHDAIRDRSCNLLDLSRGFKVDLFVSGNDDYSRSAMQRFVERTMEPGGRTFRIATAEDILLRKLEWFRAGGETSDRQWSDVLGIVRLRERDLDRGYLRRWAPHLGVEDVLERALKRVAGQR